MLTEHSPVATKVVLINASANVIWTVADDLEQAQTTASEIGGEPLRWVTLSSSEYSAGAGNRYVAIEVPCDREWEAGDAEEAKKVGRIIGYYSCIELDKEPI